MATETSGIYGKPNFKLIVLLFAAMLLVFIFAGWLFLRSGHPVMHVEPQPKNNKGMLHMPQKAAPVLEAALHPADLPVTAAHAISRS